MLVNLPYRADRAVAYARTWALSRNPLFIDFTGFGGNCTNFVSQCILAGGGVMNYTPDFGWYYIGPNDRAPAWTGVEYFYNFITSEPLFLSRNGGVGPFAAIVRRPFAVPGDVIQLADENGDWYHSMLISEVKDSEIYVCAHSIDSLDRALSTYTYADIRFLHILGVYAETDNTESYEYLLRGGRSGEIFDPEGD